MSTASPAYVDRTASRQKKPVYYVHFGPVGAGNGNEPDLTLTGNSYSQTASNISALNIGSTNVPSQFTIRGWINMASYPANGNTYGLATRSSLLSDFGDWAFVYYNFSGSNYGLRLNLNENAVSLQSTTVLNLNTWYFVEASYDPTLADTHNLKIFVNGVLDTQSTIAYTAAISNSNNPLVIGSYLNTSGSGFSGQMSEWEFCANCIRNTGTVVGTQYYTPPLQIVPDTNTTVCYHMNEGNGNILFDSSGNGINGTLTTSASPGSFSLNANIRPSFSVLADLPMEFATGPIQNATKTRQNIMLMPESVSQQITPLAGQSTIGGVNMDLSDINGVVTQMISNYPMKNRFCTIYGGYSDIDEQYFTSLFEGIVNDIQMMDDSAGFTFALTDFQREMKTQAFDSVAQLTVVMDTNSNAVEPFQTAYVSTLQGFAPQTDMLDGRGAVNFIRVDDEVMSYSSVTPASPGQPASFNNIQRGLMNTSVVTHSVNATVKNFIQLDGNPIDIALQLMLSTGTKTNGPFDVLPASQGAGIDQALVDVESFTSQRDLFLKSDRMLFYLQDPLEVKTFLEDEIFKWENCYIIIENGGLMGLKVFHVPLASQDLAVFDDTNTLPNPSFDMNLTSQSGFFNEVISQFDYDPIQGSYVTNQLNENITSQGLAGGEIATLNMTSQGIRSGSLYQGAALVNRFANNVFRRYGGGAPIIEVTTHYSNHLVNVGDLVILNTSSTPNLTTGQRGGLNSVCEVTNKEIDFAAGTVQFDLLATGFAVNRKYGAITNPSILNTGPNGGTFPVYTNANVFQKQFSFIGLKAGVNQGFQSNGDPGTYIAP